MLLGFVLLTMLLWGLLAMRPGPLHALDAACRMTDEFSVSLRASAERLAYVQSIMEDVEGIIRSSQNCTSALRDSAASTASVAEGWRQRTEGVQLLMKDTKKSLDTAASLIKGVPVLKMLSPVLKEMSGTAGEYEESMQETRDLLQKLTSAMERDAAGSLEEVGEALPRLNERIGALRRNCEEYRKSLALSGQHAGEVSGGIACLRRHFTIIWALLLVTSVALMANGMGVYLVARHLGGADHAALLAPATVVATATEPSDRPEANGI